MWESKTNRLLVFGFLFLVVFIPSSTFLIGKRMSAATLATQPYNQTVTTNNAQEIPSASPIQGSVLGSSVALDSGNPADNASSPPQVVYGPQLSFSVSIQGRPPNNQSGSFFVGIAQGDPSNNPQYLISFTINMPSSGKYSGLSLVGLSPGTNYTAYIKGPAQLVKAVPFSINPQGAVLNGGQPINLISGDLNQDNVIDAQDLIIAKAALGQTSSSSNWNPNVDINADGIINNIDLAIVTGNQGKIGDSGPWYSRIDSSASNSAQLNSPSHIGGSDATFSPYPKAGGYWMWVPSAQ